jgi:hypothetical protein
MCFVFMCILEGEFKFHYQIAGIFLQKWIRGWKNSWGANSEIT